MLIATKAQLRVFSAMCSNIAVVWLVATFATRDILTLTRDIIYAIFFIYLASKAEELLENYD